MSKDLLQQIDDLVASKTFNLDALDGIKKLKDDLAKQLSETELFKTQLEKSQKDNQYLLNELQQERGKVDTLKAEQSANAKTIEQGQAAIWEKKIAQASADAWKEAMQTVFRPSSVRETMWQSVPIAQNMNGSTYVSAYQQETKTTKEEL